MPKRTPKSKASAERKRTRPAPIQFRAEQEFEVLLKKFADEQNLSANAAAKYLAALAGYGLDKRHFEQIHQLSELMGGSFDRVCAYVARALQNEEATRQKKKEQQLDENQRQLLIRTCLTELTQQLRYGYLPTYVRVQLTHPAVTDEEQDKLEVHVRRSDD